MYFYCLKFHLIMCEGVGVGYSIADIFEDTFICFSFGRHLILSFSSSSSSSSSFILFPLFRFLGLQHVESPDSQKGFELFAS